MSIEIESNVPLPGARGSLGNLPLSQMQVNDSFKLELPQKEEKRKKMIHALRVRLLRFKKDNEGTEFTTSTKTDEGYIRVYRIQ